MHETDFFHEHAELTEAERADIARYIWSQETVELTTVGIDIGSSTSTTGAGPIQPLHRH
jgi:ethanolamine utilization protein EutA